MHSIGEACNIFRFIMNYAIVLVWVLCAEKAASMKSRKKASLLKTKIFQQFLAVLQLYLLQHN